MVDKACEKHYPDCDVESNVQEEEYKPDIIEPS